MKYILTFDTCAIIIMMIFLISFIIRKQVKGRNNFIIFIIVVDILIASIADAANGAISNYADATSTSFMAMYISNYVYFITHNLIMPLYILYIYASVDIWHLFYPSKVLRRSWAVFVAITILPLLVNVIFPGFVFSIGDGNEYIRGPFLAAFYVMALVFTTWAMIIVIKYRRFMNKDRLFISIAMLPIAALGLVLQLFFPEILLEMFSLSLSFMLYMVIVRREENQIDPITGAIKYNEGILKLSRNFLTSKPVNVVLIKIMNQSNTRMYLGQESFDEYLRMNTNKYHNLIKKNMMEGEVYYFENGLFMCLCEEADQDAIRYLAIESMQFANEEIEVGEFIVRSEGRVCVVKCPQDIQDLTTLMTVGNTFHETMPDIGQYNMFCDYKENRDFKIRSEIDDIISRAVKDKSFEMYYQPIYSISQKRYIAAEALIRLKDPVYGNVSPGLFIPASEINGMIHDIGDFVLEEVIRFVSDNKIGSLGLEYIEMNLSASQCIEIDLVDKVRNLMEKYDVQPGQISLELTETAADINPVIVDHNIKTLHGLGIRIALDDYGTGYSNIKRVTSLPIDQVKLDKSFVDMIDDKQMWIVIQDTVNMLKEMGKEILVEGVEDEDVAKKFTDIEADLIQGCELMQGFYFCKPLPAEDFVEFIKSHRTRR